MTPLSLSQSQLELVMQGAALVPLCFRGRYLDNVVDQLLGFGSVTDELVQSAVTRTLERFGVKAVEPPPEKVKPLWPGRVAI